MYALIAENEKGLFKMLSISNSFQKHLNYWNTKPLNHFGQMDRHDDSNIPPTC